MTPFLDAATQYAKAGWKVFPLWPKSKKPMTTHGLNDASDDHKQIIQWWQAKRDANVAVACGAASGIFVIDLDAIDGKLVYRGSKLAIERFATGMAGGRAALSGDTAKAVEINNRLLPLHQRLFIETSPSPVKWAMARMGLCGGTLRLPMTELSTPQQPVVEAALRASGLI